MLYYEFFVLKLIVCPAHIMMPALSVPTLFFYCLCNPLGNYATETTAQKCNEWHNCLKHCAHTLQIIRIWSSLGPEFISWFGPFNGNGYMAK